MFKKLWKILLVILIVVCIFFPVLAPIIGSYLTTAGFPLLASAVTAVGSGLAALGGWGYLIGGAVGFGLAFAMDPETTTEIIDDVVSVAATVASGIADIAGGVASSLFAGAWPLLLLGLGYFALRGDRKASNATAPPFGTDDPNQQAKLKGTT